MKRSNFQDPTSTAPSSYTPPGNSGSGGPSAVIKGAVAHGKRLSQKIQLLINKSLEYRIAGI